MIRIVLVEDDSVTAHEIRLELRRAGYEVVHCETGTSALSAIREQPTDAIIVDRRLPDMEGLEIIKVLRDEALYTPVLVLSALSNLDERVRGLRAGGDDYLAKPFALVELAARIEALLRRPGAGAQLRYVVGPVNIDLLAGTATRDGRPLHLARRELKLLEYLVRHEKQVVTRLMLLRDVWGYSFNPRSNVVDVHIGRLRRKVDLDGDIPLIHSVRGQGYRFHVPR
ncbi:MAG: response regulator transcription factor [Rhodanobacter sp.]|nr:MAG: response regulator transcription factor [Rhodanobacter sp.]